MLFTSPEFIFLFLPTAVLIHYSMATHGAGQAVLATTATSIFFYCWWNPPYIALLIGSVVVNYALACLLLRSDSGRARLVLAVGILANLSILAHYKYSDFLVGLLRGQTVKPMDIPLALSFTTFVQVAFLLSASKERKPIGLGNYAMFVTFFPHLIAGPLVRWSHLHPQIDDPSRYKVNWENIACGLTIFVIGLAKKILVADKLALFVAPVFDAAARGDTVAGAAAWGGAIAYSLQLYFDFSGYSDMAVGLGLLFNMRLPVNFATPFRATSVIDLWHRWHISLSQFLRDFIYIPFGGSRRGRARQYLNLFITMTLGGLWHGAGLTFVIWGALHGVLLALNHAWRSFSPIQIGNSFLAKLICWTMTFGMFAIGMVFFRASDMSSALLLLKAMSFAPQNPVDTMVVLPWDRWGINKGLFSQEIILSIFGSHWTVIGSLWTLGALLLATRFPDTMEIVRYREGIEDIRPMKLPSMLSYSPSVISLAFVFILFCGTFLAIGRVREFLYYQF